MALNFNIAAFFGQSVYIDDTDDEQSHNGSPNLEHMAKVS